MANNRFVSRTFTNSNSIRNQTNVTNPRFDNNRNERNYSQQQQIQCTSDDWDAEINDNNGKQESQLFDRKDNKSFQDFTHSTNNFNRNNDNYSANSFSRNNDNYSANNFNRNNDNYSANSFNRNNDNYSANNSDRNNDNYSAKGISRDYVIDTNDVSRVIGKGGATIKQIQKDNDVQIKICNDRQSQWVDVTISGSNDQAINNGFNHIKTIIGSIKEKNESSFKSDSTANNTSSFSKPNETIPRTSNNFFSSNNRNDQNNSFSSNNRSDQNNFFSSNNRNDQNNFSPRGRGFTGPSNNRNTNEFPAPQFKSGKSSNRRFAAGDDEDEDYNALFGSDDEKSNKYKSEQVKDTMASAFPSASLWNTDGNKRVDWNKMRRTDTANDMTKWKDFPPVIKEFYHELSDIAQMSTDDVEALRLEKNNIVVSWFDSSAKEEYEKKNNCQLIIPNPIYEFAHAFHNYPEIMSEIAKQGFLEPSPIQCQAWPVALRGQDFIGIAQTGTGKTLAFLLPALIHIDNQPQTKTPIHGPKALILSPTRELAIQIHQEVQKYSYRGIRSAVIYGGSSRKNQIYQCETGVEIIIATPGRLNDLVMSNVIDLRSVTFLVLDEADRMLDMGFEPQIVKILLDIRPDRQTIMTSATWPEEVRRIASRYMHNAVQIYIGSLDLAAVHSVQQDIEIVKEEEKFDILLDFIGRMGPDDKAIIFVDRKSTADNISSELIRKHISCQSIHGDREQSDREQALEDLKLGTVNILVATDVASRGIDIQDITVVFNYDLPKSMEDYVHRVGRTGRAGKTGYAISLVTRENWSGAGRLIKILEEAGQNVPGELRVMADRFKAMQDRKREFGGGQNRFGNRDNGGGGRFFGLGSINPRGGHNGRDRDKLPSMNSGKYFYFVLISF
ncbi:unnamed protein product [Adineta steineri]|uniref:RNA helicase n=1 Tax=Adineta steineri TaxID=433720 RepID=A0A815A4U8_9BILA|nr:unnamed protein product [Adineta steineri]CAF3661052.1 unnamed protein product [Adineta steineri]